VSYSKLKSLSFIIELNRASISLDEVVIAANRWEEQKIEIPYHVVKINMREAGFQNPQTSADLLVREVMSMFRKASWPEDLPC